MYYALLLAQSKCVQVVQVIVLSKWFSRQWFPFMISVWWLTNNSIPKFIKDTLTCDENNLQDYQYNIECMKAASLYGIYSCILTLFMSCMVLLFYTIDPMDRGLLINEQCFYLTSTHTELKKATSLNRFILDFYSKTEMPGRVQTSRVVNQRVNSDLSSGL